MGKQTKTDKKIKTKTTETHAVRTGASGSLRKARRYRSGTVAKREIKRLQKSVEYCLKKAPFRRLLVEIGADIKDDLYMTEGAKDALQHASEEYLTNYFEAGYVVAEQSSSRPVSTLKPRHTRTANNVALCFPGRPVDYDFKERQAARMRAQPRTTPKKQKSSSKKQDSVPHPKVASLPKSMKDKKERKEKRDRKVERKLDSTTSTLLSQISEKNSV